MNKLMIAIIFSLSLFADTDTRELHRNKIINKNDWQLNPYSSEWAKKITQPENCGNKGSLDKKIFDVMTISTNVMQERPDVWLNGKYLEFVNNRCSLSGTYTLRDTTKKDFEKQVDKYFYTNSKELTQSQKDYFLKNIKIEEQNSYIINIILIITVMFVIFRIYQSLKEPKSRIPRKNKSNFSRFFWWWSIWGPKD
jgi:hypothetical protein